jgi:hypothetical protein
VKTRPAIPPDKRLDEINTHNELLKKRLVILQDIRRHGRVLQLYFQALAELAGSDAPQTAAAAAEGAFASLSKLSPAIRTAKVGEASVGALIPAVTKPIVASFKVRALERELELRSEAIANEIALQEAAFTAIGQLLATDLKVQLNTFETEQVNNPFAADGVLPGNWAGNREQLLKMTGTVASAERGAAARSCGRRSSLLSTTGSIAPRWIVCCWTSTQCWTLPPRLRRDCKWLALLVPRPPQGSRRSRGAAEPAGYGGPLCNAVVRSQQHH